MFLVDLEQGRIVDDDELKHELASAKPYGKWLAREHGLAGRPAARRPRSPAPITTRCCSGRSPSATRSRTSSTSSARWATAGEEAIGSMGTDTPLAVLSDRAQPLFNYFKQLFAQVTNPPLDAIREELVTSVFTGAGGEGNLLEPEPENCRQIALEIADPRQRRAGAAQAARRLARVQVGRRCRCSSRPPSGAAGLAAALAIADRPGLRGDRAGGQPDRPLRPRRQRRDGADPVAAGLLGAPSRDGPPRAAVPRRAGRSSAATPARSTTSPCCWATAPARSTPTSPSRRSTT